MAEVVNVNLSAEQRQILETCRSPNDENKPLVRVTAAAGTGKTTTLLALATQAAKLGHRRITYLTFNRSAAEDAVKRLSQVQGLAQHGAAVDGRTLHSCALRLLRVEDGGVDYGEHRPKLKDDTEIEKIIRDYSKEKINAFLRDWKAPEKPERNRESLRAWEDRHRERAIVQVVTFIRKSLVQFCRSNLSLEELEDHATRNRDYYPAKKYHKAGAAGPAAGFPPRIYTETRIRFYSDEAFRLFGVFKACNILSHDLVMKRAQLDKAKIELTSLLLVDESQDLDGCQIDWAVQQHKLYGTHVYFVGDCAQSIYSFRGAKAKNLMCIEGVTDDCTLTKSWRFGDAVARIANCALFCKEKSPHTPPEPRPDKDPKFQKGPTWKPYRVIGGASNNSGTVTNESILPQWKTIKQVTVIAATNVTLLEKAVSMLGMPAPDHDEKEDEMNELPEEDVFYDALMEIEVPKFCINGKGQSSGRNKWKLILKQVEELAALFLANEDGEGDTAGSFLDEKLFPEFYGRRVTWDSFKNEVESRELDRYLATISVVDRFGKRTTKALELFEKEVMSKNYSQEEADVILTTCHSAKGMEWDNVEVCGDFCDIWNAKLDGPRIKIENLPSKPNSEGCTPCDVPNTPPPSPEAPQVSDNEKASSSPVISNPYKRRKTEDAKFRSKSYQFDCKAYKDDINLIYVAITRAKRMLSIDERLWKFLQDCDFLHDWTMAEQRPDFFGALLGVKIKKKSDLEELYHDLIMPLRQENEMNNSQSICELLITTSSKDEVVDDE